MKVQFPLAIDQAIVPDLVFCTVAYAATRRKVWHVLLLSDKVNLLAHFSNAMDALLLEILLWILDYLCNR